MVKKDQYDPNPMKAIQGRYVVRNLDCSFYEDCLDEVVKRQWSSFTCRKCGRNGCRDKRE